MQFQGLEEDTVKTAFPHHLRLLRRFLVTLPILSERFDVGVDPLFGLRLVGPGQGGGRSHAQCQHAYDGEHDSLFGGVHGESSKETHLGGSARSCGLSKFLPYSLKFRFPIVCVAVVSEFLVVELAPQSAHVEGFHRGDLTSGACRGIFGHELRDM